jgi:AcrR family transcriptional regulator
MAAPPSLVDHDGSERADPGTGAIRARRRILDAGVELMGRHGSAGTSMRQLAAAAGLNVATLYHYFPSKADLLHAVIEERRYDERLLNDPPPIEPSTPPGLRLVGLVEWLWDAALEEEDIWRLLIGEALRNEETAITSARSLVDDLERTFEQWLRDQVFALVVEHLATGSASPRRAATARAADLAALLFR